MDNQNKNKTSTDHKLFKMIQNVDLTLNTSISNVDTNLTTHMSNNNAHDLNYLPKCGCNIWYINKITGNDLNIGDSPTDAFETIGAGITAMSVGDSIHIAPGTYTETGLDLNKNNSNMVFELGAILDPATGTGLIISGDYCVVTCPCGSLKITPSINETGMIISGKFCYIHDVRISCFITDEANSADIGFDITGDGCVLNNCRCSSPDVAAFKIQGDTILLRDCCTGGSSSVAAFSSIGYWCTNSCDKARMIQCGSQGHGAAGFQVDAGCTNGVFFNCSSGGGDGKGTDIDNSFVWSNCTYDDTIFKTITFNGNTTYNLFKVTGAVRIFDLYGEVITIIPAINSQIHIEAYSTGGTADITNAPGVQINAAVVGCMFAKLEGMSDPLIKADPNTIPAVMESSNFRDPKVPIDVIKDNSADTYIRLVLSIAQASGAIKWHCKYEPLTNDGFLESV